MTEGDLESDKGALRGPRNSADLDPGEDTVRGCLPTCLSMAVCVCGGGEGTPPLQPPPSATHLPEEGLGAIPR